MWKRGAVGVCKSYRKKQGSYNLDRLGTISLDHIRKRPTLALQLFVFLDLHPARLGHDPERIAIQAAGIPIEEHLHTGLDSLDGLLPRHLPNILFVVDQAPEQGLSELGAVAGGQGRGGEGGAEEVDAGEEGSVVVIEAGDEDGVPERVDVGAALVHDLGEVGVEVVGVEGVAGGGVGFGDGEGGEGAVEVLHVGDVAADAKDGAVVEGEEAFDVGEAGEGAV